MRDLLELSSDDNELIAAKKLAHREGPISIILAEMDDFGYWVETGPGYTPKYRSTVWSIIMLAFCKLPPDKRTNLIENAIQKGVDFLLGVDPAEATYLSGWSNKPSGNWWKFGFPVFYITDLLQNVEALIRLGYGNDPRLSNALNIIREKQE